MLGVEGRQAGGTHPSILIHMTISMQNPEPNQRRVKIIHSSWGLVVLALVLAGPVQAADPVLVGQWPGWAVSRRLGIL